MKQKQEWFNNLRAVATIAVIIIHVSSEILFKYGKIAPSYWLIALFYNGASRFCIPTFFMISGALLLKKDEGIKVFFCKRFLKIIPPFIFWSLVYTFYDAYIVSHKTYGLWTVTQKAGVKLLHGSQYHLWFVYTLLGLYILIPILRKWIKNASINEIRFLLMIWLCTFLYPFIGLKPNQLIAKSVVFLGYLGYMILGYYLTQIKFQKKPIIIILAFFGLLATLLGTLSRTQIQQSLNSSYFHNISFNILAYASGVFLFFKSVPIKNIPINKVLTFISEYSFGIYLVHVLVIKLLNILSINWKMMNPILSIPLTSFICLSSSALIIYLLRKVKYLNIVAG